MTRVPTPQQSYFRVEAILEAPVWALIFAILLVTVAVVASAVAAL
jgi:hypothetical protein